VRFPRQLDESIFLRGPRLASRKKMVIEMLELAVKESACVHVPRHYRMGSCRPTIKDIYGAETRETHPLVRGFINTG